MKATQASICSVEGCERPVRARGWCTTHNTRYQRHGDPLYTRWASPLTRFMEKVVKDEVTGCWLWQAALNAKGYGHFSTSRDLAGPAHRRGYELMVGPVPKDLTLDHLCRVRACVNPEHLEVVSQQENVRRAVEARRRGGIFQETDTDLDSGNDEAPPA